MYARNAAQQLLGMFLDPWALRYKPRFTTPARKRPKYGNVPASINRWTGKPHEHRREVARRTTHPGTEARRLAMAQASNPA